jgi:molybdopterin-guanine dinucleotide biosynthesis protein A
VVGIVLAGGRSLRFGASDKLLTEYLGIPLVHHAILRLAEVCPRVVLVAGYGTLDPALPPGVHVSVVHDATADQGPLAGLLAGLGGSAGAEMVVVAGGDMPDLRVPVLLEMLRVAGEAPADAVALNDAAGMRPLPCVLRLERAAEAAHALLHGGEASLRALLRTVRTAAIDEETWTALDPGRRTLFDVDVPKDLG